MVRAFFRTLLVGLAVSSILTPAGFAVPAYSTAQVYQFMERYQSFSQEASGDWTAYDQHAAQLLRQVQGGAAKQYTGSGCILLYPSFRGNQALGLVEPVLNVLLLRNSPIGADALSIAVEGFVYDFVARPEQISIGSTRCEHFQLPLEQTGLTLLKQLSRCEYSVAVYADTRTVQSTVIMADVLSGKAALEAQSRQIISVFLGLYEQIGMKEYPLWDRNACYWSQNRPELSIRWPIAQTHQLQLNEFGCVDSADRAGVKALQKLLSEGYFYAGKIDGKLAAQTRQAIREAQLYYGLLPTGQADAELLHCLTVQADAIMLDSMARQTAQPLEGDTVTVSSDPADFEQAQMGTQYDVEGIALVCLDRVFIVSKILASRGTIGDSGAEISPRNSSNRLLVVDGWLLNKSQCEITLSLDCSMAFTFPSGYTYYAILRGEQAEGTQWNNRLLPMERTRIVGCAEIPEDMAEAAQNAVEISFQITAQGQSLTLRYS